MSHIAGASREHQGRFPDVLADYIAEEQPVRFLDAFVESLDLDALGFRRVQPAAPGRPASHPGDLRKLSSDGSMHRIRSSRRLEQETPRNVERLGRLRKRHPDVKTLAEFRQDNVKAFKQVCRACTLLCQAWELCGHELGAIDGTQVTAVHSQRRHFTHATRTETLPRLAAYREHYLHDLDTADAEEAECQKPTADALREKIRHLRERQGRDEGLMRALERTGQSQVSLPDPDSRAMPKSPNVEVGYTAQVAVEGTPPRFVVHAVTHAVTDVDQLRGIALPAKAALEAEQITVVADMGDSHGEARNAWAEAGIEPSVAKPLTSAHRTGGLDGKERCTYEPAHDGYRCPAGQALSCRFATVELGRHIRYEATTACRACALQARCTRNQEGRRLTRWVHEPILEPRRQRVEATPALMKRRQQIVAQPFGPIKPWHDQGYVLMKGLAKVRAAFSVSTLAYTLRRVVTMLGVPHRLRALACGETRGVP